VLIFEDETGFSPHPRLSGCGREKENLFGCRRAVNTGSGSTFLVGSIPWEAATG
jgi:hypothetical protein